MKRNNNNRPQTSSRQVTPNIRGGRGGGGKHGMREKPKDSKNTIKKMLKDIGSQKKTLLWVVLIVIVAQIIVQLSTILYGQTVKEVQTYANTNTQETRLIFLAAVTFVTYFLSSGISFLQQFLVVRISQNTVFGMRTNLFEKIQKLSLKFFDSNEKGDLMSRVTNDIETVSNTLSNTLISLIASLSSLIFTLIVMFIYSWQLSLVAMVSVPFVILLTTKFSSIARKLYREQQKNLGWVNANIEETITGQKVVKVFAAEERELSDFDEANQAYKKSGIKAQMLGGSMGPIFNFLNNLTFLMIAIAGASMVVNGNIEVWLLSQFFIYARTFGRPISNLAQMMPEIQSAIAGAERVYKIMDEDEEILDAENALSVKSFEGNVEFDDVNFSYVEDVQVLKNVSIKADPGQTIALVGPTGAGKTTIINLLTRFYDIQKGEIKIDGINITGIKKNDLRSQLGIVLQDVYLFAASVMDNIKYGNLNATDEEVITAAKKANAHQFIHRLPNGYNTMLNEDGTNLSQGQRQLLSIARAMLNNPSILILDEATSSVDTRTEINIQRAMLELMKGRTSFVIAHRLSTIKNADNILVIDDGKIIESGNHNELLLKKGFYYNLYNSQFRNTEN